MLSPSSLPEVYTARDVAEAAGVAEQDVRRWLEAGDVRTVAALLPGAADPRWADFIPHA